MSFQAMADAVKLTTKNTNQKCLLIMLANYADENNTCYPSQQRLADDCCMSISTVKRTLSELKKAGYISWNQRKKDQASKGLTSNRYTLHLSNNELAQSERGVGSERAGGRVRVSEEPINEPIKKSSSKPAKAVLDFDSVLKWILQALEKSGKQLNAGDLIYTSGKLEEYLERTRNPSKADAFSYCDQALNNRIGIEMRSMKASQARDELLNAQVSKMQASTKKASKGDLNKSDRAWAEQEFNPEFSY